MLLVLLCEQDNVSALETTTNAHAQLVAPLQHAPAAGNAVPRVSQPAADLADLEAVLARANLSEIPICLPRMALGPSVSWCSGRRRTSKVYLARASRYGFGVKAFLDANLSTIANEEQQPFIRI